MPLIYVIGSSRQKEAAALKIKATASKARENVSALRRLFFFCRRPADCSVIKGLMFLDILKTIYK